MGLSSIADLKILEQNFESTSKNDDLDITKFKAIIGFKAGVSHQS